MAFSEDASITKVKVWKVHGQEIKPQQERLATESLLTLSINGFQAYQLLYLPGQEIELSIGFLLTSGAIEATADILEMRLIPADQLADRAYSQVQVRLAKTFNNKQDLSTTIAAAALAGTEAAGQCLMADQFRKFSAQPVQVSVVEILNLMTGLPGRQEIFRQTGATHAIFLAEAGRGKVILGAEDVGRHNAFDKVIGQALMKNLAMGDKIALLSGRASFEMVFQSGSGRHPHHVFGFGPYVFGG